MKEKYLRVLTSAVLFSLISGIVVTIIGLILGWKTYTQFSDGFFYGGTIMFVVGFLNVMATQNQMPNAAQQPGPLVHMDRDERFKIWAADISRGYNFMLFLAISGLLMFVMAGIAILLGRLV